MKFYLKKLELTFKNLVLFVILFKLIRIAKRYLNMA